jgi:hypothetical protein
MIFFFDEKPDGLCLRWDRRDSSSIIAPFYQIAPARDAAAPLSAEAGFRQPLHGFKLAGDGCE